jgi:hypothetical protein
MHTQLRTAKTLATIAAWTLGLVVVCFIVLLRFVAMPGPSEVPVDAGQVVGAITNFCAAHQPPPQTVTFSQLIAQGYLSSNVLARFGASEVTVFLNADETHPDMFLMDALMPDGSHTTLMSDGSVIGFSKSRFQQAAAPNGGPASPLTNSDGLEGGRHQSAR